MWQSPRTGVSTREVVGADNEMRERAKPFFLPRDGLFSENSGLTEEAEAHPQAKYLGKSSPKFKLPQTINRQIETFLIEHLNLHFHWLFHFSASNLGGHEGFESALIVKTTLMHQ